MALFTLIAKVNKKLNESNYFHKLKSLSKRPFDYLPLLFPIHEEMDGLWSMKGEPQVSLSLFLSHALILQHEKLNFRVSWVIVGGSIFQSINTCLLGQPTSIFCILCTSVPG